MNEDIDLTKILKNCPEGFELYTPLCGKVFFLCVNKNITFSILVWSALFDIMPFTKEGYYSEYMTNGECLLFPSKEMRDWGKFTTSWYKKNRFDPATLMPFDKVLVKSGCSKWTVSLFSFVEGEYVAVTNNARFSKCIPFNDETKYLLGTTDEAPEYYRYWDKDEGQYN